MELEFREQINEGIACMKAASYDAAVEAFQNAVRLNPKNAEAYVHLGNAFVNQRAMDDSIKAFKTALMLQPNDGSIYFSIGSVYYLKNDFVSAIRYLNLAEDAGFKTVDLYSLRSGIFAQSEDYTQAIREMAKAIELKPLRADLYKRKAALQMQANQNAGALETLEEFRTLIPEALESYDLSVQIYCMRQEYDKAMEIVKSGIERFPDDPAMHFMKLRVLGLSGQYEESVKVAKQLLAGKLNDQMEKQTVIYLAESYAKMGQADQMAESLVQFTQKKKDQDVMYLLLIVYAGNKQFQELKKLSEELRAIASSKPILAAADFCHAEAVEHLGCLEEARKEYKLLTSELRKMTIQNPELYEVYIYRLLSHTALEEYDKALALADYLDKAYPDRPDGHVYRHYIYTKSGDMDKAAEEKEKALKIDPNLKL